MNSSSTTSIVSGLSRTIATFVMVSASTADIAHSKGVPALAIVRSDASIDSSFTAYAASGYDIDTEASEAPAPSRAFTAAETASQADLVIRALAGIGTRLPVDHEAERRLERYIESRRSAPDFEDFEAPEALSMSGDGTESI